MKLTDRQEQAALDHTKSKCVIAGAGTGKTHVLVQKYISLLEEGVGAGEILALTFTEKAAGEMKIRVRRALAEKEGEQWDGIRDEFLWAKVSTFHAFCAAVLREFPVEADVGPGFSVLDEREAARLREEAADNLIHGEPPEGDREAVIGALRAIGAYELKNYLERLYIRRDAAETFFTALAEDEEAVIDAWRAALEQWKEDTIDAVLARVGPSIETLRNLAARYPETPDPAGDYLRAVGPHLSWTQDAIIALAGVHRNGGFRANMGRKANWAGDDLNRLRTAYRTLDGCIKDHAGALFSPVPDTDDAFTRVTLAFLHDLGTVYHAFIREVEAEKRRQNALDFDDLVNRTRRLLCDHERVTAHFSDRFRFVLVDEFQDTDPVQIAVIHAILGDLTRASAKLFVVGDPKQSIYLFREADVTQFSHTRDLIEQNLDGEAVPLDINFRSTPEIVGFTNAVFGALMAGCDEPWEFLYEPLRANRSEETGSIEILLSPKMKDRQAGRRSEAELVAKKIRALVEGKDRSINRDGERRAAGYGDVAILLERRTNLAYYEWALERYGVPYRIHAGPGFYERQEVYDLYNILRFLVNDLDDVALYGALRSPYFGFSDARLFAVARAGTPLYLCLQGDRGPDTAAATRLLSSWLSHARRLPPAHLIRRIVEESGIFVILGGTAGGEQAIANIEKIIAAARDAACSTLAGFVEELGRCIDGGEREGDAHLDLTAGDMVAIMTVHAAKGLEFPVVIVPDLAETPRIGGASIMIEDGLLLGVSIPDPAGDYEREETAVLRLLKDRYRQKEEAEQKRLFYVAVTRARDHLILCGEEPGEVPESLHAAKSRMDWIAHCLGLSGEVRARGETVLTIPGEKALRIPITIGPEAIPVTAVETTPVRLPLPNEDAAAGVEAHPLLAGEEEHVYSASELENYIRNPEGFGQRDGIPGITASREEAVTRGLVVHEIFRGREPAAVLRRYGMDAGLAGEYRELYERFRTAPLMQGIIRDHCEVPFFVRMNGTLFRGVIDRLVQQPDGTWMLIDYKTGKPGDMKEYTVQMTIYRHAAARILGGPVTPCLYFVDVDRWVEVTVDDEQVVTRIEQAIREIKEKNRQG